MPFISEFEGLAWRESNNDIQFRFKVRCPYCGFTGVWTPTKTFLINNSDDFTVYRNAQTNAINGVEIWIQLNCPNCDETVAIHMAIHRSGQTIFTHYDNDLPPQWWVDTSDESGSTEVTGEYRDTLDSEIDRYIIFTVDTITE